VFFEYAGQSGALGAVLISLILAGLRMKAMRLILWSDLLVEIHLTVPAIVIFMQFAEIHVLVWSAPVRKTRP